MTALGGAAFNACGSRSGGATGSTASASTYLAVSTSTATGIGLELRLDVLALERDDGTFTANLVPPGTALAVASPMGSASGLSLGRVPAGTYVAMRLAVGSTSATLADGSRHAVELPQRDLRIAIANPAATTPALLVVSHATPPDVQRGSDGIYRWTPALVGRRADTHAVDGAELAITAFDPATGRVDGTLAAVGGWPLRLDVDDRCALSDDSGPIDRRAFLAGLRNDDRLECTGAITDDGSLVCTRVHRRGRGAGDSKVYGRIVALLAAEQSFRLQVLEIARGGGELRRDPLPEVLVRAGRATIYRSGVRHVQLDFTALAVDMRVEVEWQGAAANDTITARKVAIEDEAGGRGGETEGLVSRVDLGQNLIVAVPRGDDPLLVDGRSVPSAEIVIVANTVIFSPDNAGRHRIELAAVQPGQRIWVVGKVLGPERVEALLVRVRQDSRR